MRDLNTLDRWCVILLVYVGGFFLTLSLRLASDRLEIGLVGEVACFCLIAGTVTLGQYLRIGTVRGRWSLTDKPSLAGRQARPQAPT